MSVIVTYDVDIELYDSFNHRVLLETTEYTYKTSVLVHLKIGKNLGIRLNNRLRSIFDVKEALQNEQFFIKKTYNQGRSKPISRGTFEEKLQRFNMSQTVVEREIVKDYNYVSKDGCSDNVQIQVIVRGGEMTAVIDFKDIGQARNFDCPNWLLPLI
jgi:hypothetical protein